MLFRRPVFSVSLQYPVFPCWLRRRAQYAILDEPRGTGGCHKEPLGAVAAKGHELIELGL
jgi:hypothetical protein